ncbi:MAG: iron-containing alcohol dehydrogenase, partial [Elusimicrobia bacterium]|nr:iron-containing alcohol dehydrogenase [Elusimicrobiota bacterium]
MNLILTPSKIVEGNKKEIQDFIKNSSEKTFLLLGQKNLFEMYNDFFDRAFKGKTKIFTDFFGECSIYEIQRILKSASAKKVDAIFGFGGGKAIDTAKSVAEKSNIPLFVLPTSGATCAAFTSHSVIYGEKNEFLYEEQHSKSPDVVILCEEILKSQPCRLIYAGLSDSIAKFWEFSFSEPKEKDPLFVEYSKEMAKQIISNRKANFYELSFITIIHTGIISA